SGSSFESNANAFESSIKGPSCLGVRRLNREIGSTFEWTRPALCTICISG
ncbi:hypothetical protein M407DRAFT_80214, partial [Tulasnella calospora MUT 4182]